MSAGDFDLIFDELQRSQVRYLVVGGVAVVLQGHPRFTADLDLVVALDPSNARGTIADLGDVKVPVASIADLIALKRVAGRPKDLEDVRVLEAIERERRNG
jgi:hypothetical protein